MSDSTFWRKLAEKFRALPIEYATLHADKTVLSNEREKAKWRLSGKVGPKAEFAVLAKRGAGRFAKTPNTDLLDLWLETIFQTVPDSHDQKFVAINKDKAGVEESRAYDFAIYNLPRRSADCCKVLESEAIQGEFDRQNELPTKSLPLLAPKDKAPPPVSVAEQILNLRVESNWPIELLAEKVGLDVRTVDRHLSGTTIPHLRNLGAYERVFSKQLKREVVIKKMP